MHGNKLEIRWRVRRKRNGGVIPPANTSFYKQTSGQIFKDDVNCFFSTSCICLMVIKILRRMEKTVG
jgi:hypothetical protein